MYLEYLLYFIEVSKSRSVNQAAKNLFISQPSLRAAILSLEKEFGTPLIQSSNQGITLTPFGEIVAREAAEIKKHFETCKAAAQEYAAAKTINVSACNVAISFLAADLFAVVRNKYPHLTLNFLPFLAPAEAISNLLNQLSSMAVIQSPEDRLEKLLRPLNGDKYSLTLLSSDSFVCYLNKDNPLVQKEAIYLADLEQMLFLTFKQNDSNVDYIDFNPLKFFLHNHAKDRTIFFPSSDIILRTINIHPNSFSFLSKSILYADNFYSNVTAKPIADYQCELAIYLLAPADKYISAEEKFIKEQIISLYRKK